MASTAVVQLAVLGELANARGRLGPHYSNATASQMTTATGIVTGRASYGLVGATVVCVEDRLHRPDPRLAGGALSLALMRNFLYGGQRLSADMRELRAMGFRLALHKDCGALKLVSGLVVSELSNTNAEGYRLLGALGVNVPIAIRRRIAQWAAGFPAGYVDLEAAIKAAHEVDDVQGQHNAVFAVISLADGVSFTGGAQLKRETNGLLAFAFDPWVARRSAARIAVNRQDALAAEMLALVFTAQVFLTLGGKDLRIAVHR